MPQECKADYGKFIHSHWIATTCYTWRTLHHIPLNLPGANGDGKRKYASNEIGNAVRNIQLKK